MNCIYCNANIPEGDDRCPECGASVSQEQFLENDGNTVKRKFPWGGIVFALISVVIVALMGVIMSLFGELGGFAYETPEDLDYITLEYSDGVYTNSITYGYKDDVIYTYTDSYIYDINGFTEDEINDIIKVYRIFAEEAKDIPCYEMKESLSGDTIRFDDIYTDMAKQENLEMFEDIGWFEEEEEEYYLSMEQTKEGLLNEGYVIVE